MLFLHHTLWSISPSFKIAVLMAYFVLGYINIPPIWLYAFKSSKIALYGDCIVMLLYVCFQFEPTGMGVCTQRCCKNKKDFLICK